MKRYIHFLHIGKTGGTAIVYALNQYNYCAQSPNRARLGMPDNYGLNLASENNHLTVYVHSHDESLRDIPEGEKVFFFLREPISRFISGFYSRQRQGQPRHLSPWSSGEKTAYERFGIVNQLASTLSSTDAGEKAMAEDAMRSIEHVRDSYWKWFESEEYLKSRVKDIFFVGFQENLAQDFELLKSKLNLPACITLPTENVLAHKNPLDVDKRLDDIAMANLKLWYKDEYRLIDLCKEISTFNIKNKRDSAMKATEKKIIVVLGMHRGGTSVVTRSLRVLGVGLGENLYPPADDNPTGFWEDRDCIAINEELLGHLGSEYDRLGLAWNFEADDPSIGHLYARAAQLVSESVAKNQGIWGMKDPRLCRLLGFWKKVFAACDCRVTYIIALRDPISVAESLENRNHIPAEKSHFLWLQHMVAAVLDSRGGSRAVVNYDSLLDAPEEQIARIAKSLNIPFDGANNAALTDFSQGFLDGKLRHSQHSLSQISSSSRLPQDALKVYELLLRVAKDEILIDSEEVQSVFEHIQANLQAYAPIFEYANLLELETERLSFRVTQSGNDEQAANLTQSVTTGKVQLMITLTERDGQIAALTQSFQALSAQVAGKEQSIQALSAQVAGKEQSIQALSAQVAEREQFIQALSAQVAGKEQSIQALSAQVAGKEQFIQALSAQVAGKEQSVQALSAQVAGKEQSIQALSAQVAEEKQAAQMLQVQLDEISKSKSWKLALLFRQIRVVLAPPGGPYTRILSFLQRNTYGRFKKISKKQETNKDIALIISSGLFDESWYLSHNPDIAQVKIDPLLHYLYHGGFEGRDPGPDFSSKGYLDTYEDVKKFGINPLVHYIKQGREEGRDAVPASPDMDGFDVSFYLRHYPDILNSGVDPYTHYIKHGRFEGRLGCAPKIELQEGSAGFEPSRDTVLVVSHEASRTGAPILSLNLVQSLQKKYNVVSFLLGDGAIAEYFHEASAFVISSTISRSDPIVAQDIIEQLTKLHKFKFAIVNSIVSYMVMPALSKCFVPTISLVHEFSLYIRPKGVFVGAALWSNELIFSTSITHENAVFDNPVLENHSFHILPQGRCALPSSEIDTAFLAEEDARVLKFLRPENLPADTVLVLGVGMVQIRKGMDLFIDCAARVIRSGSGKNFRFVWIGKGYDPELDLNYSIYLADQVHRAGLDEHLFFMEETASIEAAYKTADVLLISSRMDPLPNVAIDAMAHGLPLVCFERATGIADILIANGLGEECVAPYLDTARMAAQVLAFAASKSFSQRVGEQLRQVALKEFDMEKYVSQLEQMGLASVGQMAQEQIDVAAITASGLACLDFFLPPNSHIRPEEAIRYYVRTWASKIERRKLFPGFHPGIFMEQYGSPMPGSEPLANYVRAGQPAGPWRYDVLSSEETAQPYPPELRIALHLHVYYPDLLPETLNRLNGNQVRPDLFVSAPTEAVREEVQKMLSENYSGAVVEIRVVPNRGRDIGPFLTAFGAAFVERYDVVGHLHTKKTAIFKDENIGRDWHIFLLENLLGGKSNMIDISIGRMASDPSIGLIFPDDPHVVDWGRNKPYAEALGQPLGLNTLPENFLFPVGTMFWARVESLLPLFKLGLDWQDYPTEPLPYDGSILHALERLLPFVASSQGFRSVLTNVTGVTR